MPPSHVLRSLWLSCTAPTAATITTTATRRAATLYAPSRSKSFSLANRTFSTSRPTLADVQQTTPTNKGEPIETQAEAKPEAESAGNEQQQHLNSQEEQQAKKYAFPSDISMPAPRAYPHDVKVGTVISVGLMDKTVRVVYRHRKWDRHIRKYYPHETTYLVSDPQNSLREGDVIEFSSGARRSPRVRHVVDRIVAPFGVGIDERPPVLTREQREQLEMEKRRAKVVRKMGRAVDEAVARNGGQPLDEAELDAVKRRFLQKQFQEGRIKRLVRTRLEAEAKAEAASGSQ